MTKLYHWSLIIIILRIVCSLLNKGICQGTVDFQINKISNKLKVVLSSTTQYFLVKAA